MTGLPSEKLDGWDDSVGIGAAHHSFETRSVDGRIHWIQVSIDNRQNPNDLQVGPLQWDGVGSDGGVYSTARTDGPDKIAAHAQGSLRVGWPIGEDHEIVELRFVSFGKVLRSVSVA